MRDVVIVGSGIPGLALGLWCLRSGLSVTMVDRDVQQGSPAGLSAAPASLQQGLLFHHVERWHGAEAARATADLIQHAHSDVRELANELHVDTQDLPVATVTTDNHEAFWVRYEAMAMRRAGLAPEFDDIQHLPWPVRPYLHSPGTAVDPVTLRDALLRAVRQGGGQFSEVVPPAANRISATPWPVVDRVGVRPRLRRATWHWADVSGLELERVWSSIDDGGVLMVPSADGARVGARHDDPVAWLARQGVSGQVLRRWQAPSSDSLDGLPFAGPLGHGDFVMAGFGPWEMSIGLAAARQVHGAITRTSDSLPWAPQRLVRSATVGRAMWGATRLRLNLNSVTPFPKAPRFRSTRHR